jgi:hypothetical protein
MRLLRSPLLALAASALSCASPGPPEAPAAPASPSRAEGPPPPAPPASPRRALHLLALEREAVQAAPGATRPAVDFAIAVEALLASRDPRVGPGDARALVDEAMNHVADAIVASRSETERALLLTQRGVLLSRAGRGREAMRVLGELLELRPSLYTLHHLLAVSVATGEKVDVPALCRQVRPTVKKEAEILALLRECMAHAGTADPDAGLAWTSPDDVRRYRRDLAERAAQDARARERIGEDLRDESEPDPRGSRDAGAPRPR